MNILYQKLDQNKGTVIKSTGSWYLVRNSDGEIIQCRLKGKLKLNDIKTTNPVAVGDLVLFDYEEENLGNIYEILPRKNYIIRKSVHKTGHASLIAANIDQAMVVVTIKLPKTSLGFIDRFLVSAEAYQIPCTLIFNKQDLLNDEEKEIQNELINLYQNIGVESILCSVKDNEGIEAIKSKLANKISLISGHSGVGKSSLINLLIPNLDLQTKEISKFANKGVHTTTFAEMFTLNKNTFIIDTPGIKEIGLVDIESNELSNYFPEMKKLENQCKFNNCVHVNEPNCAVIDALEKNEIALSRYKSYLSMLEGDDNRK